ncbi:uncharacterized protein LOC124638078 [Helicoverpa zea]|uniref:uncharacterized protein LOC124638078 n=1 Tax=Helicoverpa zea TaxID=7113 RepID=UPI001F567987|nr:uncharacterized protein LOC124638078 [Helicoverpa zea]XP_047030863.1 uncharacterized protein LOC124638078 [Helicoverpa zea]
MSTRRARIKAVTSLPPRRKNNDAANNTKAKLLEKETLEKPARSPKTPRAIKTQDNLDRCSPKPASPLKSPRSVNILKSQEKVPSPLVAEVSKEAVGTPKRSEKVSVITSTYSVKSNVFVSPKSVGSPAKRFAPSPLVQTRVDVNIQRITPCTPEKHKQKNADGKAVEIDLTDGKSAEFSKGASSNVASDVPDDYNVPSVPESITEDAVMDGIVPLQAVSGAPKPLALLKNEIISENAEVLFDPIVPLPSPSKLRPKLRPVPRLAPLRRNSVQGSASESEDENRRALLSSGGTNTPAPSRQRHDSHITNREVARVRNDSVCSSVSQATTQPPAASSPVKDKPVSKSRRVDTSRRNAAMRRRREAVNKDELTMYDLIFYNPTTNPIVPDKDELQAQEANEKEEAARKASMEVEETPAEQPETDAAPVPQIKLGPNGEIMLDEQSLVIKSSDKRKVSSSVVHEGAWATSNTSGRYRRTPRTADWCDAETVRFYRALAALGTDFMLMERLFPGRTRRDLKLKFKKEERVNMAQIDKALRTTCKWDANRLLDEFQAEREEADRKAQAEAEEQRKQARELREKQKEMRELRVRMSRGSKALGTSSLPLAESILTADDIIKQHHEMKAQQAKAAAMPRPRGRPPSKPGTLARARTTTTKPTSQPTDQDKATIPKLDPTKSQGKTPDQRQTSTPTPVVPSNIENGSLVVLTVNDPNSPSKKMLQTYIAGGGGRLTPVALPPSFLNSVVTYMKKGGGTPKSNMSAGSSPHLMSPSSVTSQDSRPCSTPGVIQINPSPAKRQRHSSYTVTQL